MSSNSFRPPAAARAILRPCAQWPVPQSLHWSCHELVLLSPCSRPSADVLETVARSALPSSPRDIHPRNASPSPNRPYGRAPTGGRSLSPSHQCGSRFLQHHLQAVRRREQQGHDVSIRSSRPPFAPPTRTSIPDGQQQHLPRRRLRDVDQHERTVGDVDQPA